MRARALDAVQVWGWALQVHAMFVQLVFWRRARALVAVRSRGWALLCGQCCFVAAAAAAVERYRLGPVLVGSCVLVS